MASRSCATKGRASTPTCGRQSSSAPRVPKPCAIINARRTPRASTAYQPSRCDSGPVGSARYLREASEQLELARVKRLRSPCRPLGPSSLKGIGVGAVIAAVYLDAADPIPLSHSSTQRRLESATVPATGARRCADEEVDQLVDERLFSVARPLSRKSGHRDPPLLRNREPEPAAGPHRRATNGQRGRAPPERAACAAEDGEPGQPFHLGPQVNTGDAVIARWPRSACSPLVAS